MAPFKALILLDHPGDKYFLSHSRLIDHLVSENRAQKYGRDHDR